MSDKPVPNPPEIDPLFDGHLERPVESMTIEERLRWIDEGAKLLHWAKQVRIESGRALPEDVQDR